MAEANKIKFGLKNCKYAVATIATDGSATYGAVKDLPGAVSLSLTAQGDTTPFYADNIVYYTAVANNGYDGSLELARIPEDFLKDVLGYSVAGNDLVYEDVAAPVVHFALLFQFEGDSKSRRHVVYNCVATRPELASQTKGENVEPQTETINITATSVYNAALQKDIVKAYLNEDDDGYTTFLGTVMQATT